MMEEQNRTKIEVRQPTRLTRRSVIGLASLSLVHSLPSIPSVGLQSILLGQDPEKRSASNHLTRHASKIASADSWIMPYYEWLSKNNVVATRGTRKEFFTTDMVVVDVAQRRVRPFKAFSSHWREKELGIRELSISPDGKWFLFD